MSIVAKDAAEHIGGAPVVLHPLVMVNITDHVTRLNLVAPGAKPTAAQTNRAHRAVGGLLGQQTGKRLEIHTSFELVYEVKGDHVEIKEDFLEARVNGFKKVFPEYDLLGWYTTGTSLSEKDISVTHKVMSEAVEDPLVLVMDVNPAKGLKNLPLWIFESSTNSATKTTTLRKVPYTVESDEIERIGVESAMRVDMTGNSNPTLAPQADRIRSAMSMLKVRISVVVGYMKAVKRKEIAPDYELLRRIANVVNQLPRSNSPMFQATFTRDYEDALLIAFLGVVTKGTTSLNKLIADANVAVERKRGSSLQAALGAMMF